MIVLKDKIAWVTDTSAMLTEEFIKKNNIFVLPIVVIFEDGPLRETIDMSLEQFYVKLKSAKKLPTTSQPVIGESIELYKRLKSEGYTCAIAIHTSSKLSNTYESSYTAAHQAGFKVYAIDSKSISYPMKKLIERGIELEKAGYDTPTIIDSLERTAENIFLTGVPANLTQLYKSGRVPGIAAMIGNLLRLNLILSFEDGLVVLKEKVRTFNKAKNYLNNLLEDQLQRHTIYEVAIVHCNNEQEAIRWKVELQQQFPTIQFIIYPFSAAIGVHAGEGTTGLSWIRY